MIEKLATIIMSNSVPFATDSYYEVAGYARLASACQSISRSHTKAHNINNDCRGRINPVLLLRVIVYPSLLTVYRMYYDIAGSVRMV